MKFYSNGKLLLTGEYLILNGAKGLALPTIFGQSLEIEFLETKGNKPYLYWKSFNQNQQCWFECVFNLPDFTFVNTDSILPKNRGIAKKLQEILIETKKLNPKFIANTNSILVKTELSFPRNWGLGTSSTLINNIAQWADVNAFELQFKIFGGSAYDIACAQHNKPIIYSLENKKPVVTPVDFNPTFKENLFFVYLNRKKNSRDAIKAFHRNKKPSQNEIKSISKITKNLLDKNLKLPEFEQLITQHEAILSKIVHLQPVKEIFFADYFGAIKSLGAWGGDFILATGNETTHDYFKSKGFDTIIPYQKMIKN